MASPKLAFSPHQNPAPDAVDRRLSGGDHRAVEADSHLAAIADRNYVGAYRKLVEHIPAGSIRLFGAVTAFTTGLPIGIFNGCIVVEPANASDLAASLQWVVGLDVPYRVWIREELASGLAAVPIGLGLEREAWLFPGMVLRSGPQPPPPAPGVTVRSVEGRQALEEHRELHISKGMSAESAMRMFPASLVADPDVRLFTAHLDGRPAGTSLAIRTADAAGVYNVGTLPDARRRGVGTAATWAAVVAGRAWGRDTIVLQSSEIGFSLYRAMGFRTVVNWVTFRPAPTPPTQTSRGPRPESPRSA